MADLEATLEYEKDKRPKAEVVLKFAIDTIKLLRTLEQERTAKRRSVIDWDVQITMAGSRATCLFSARAMKGVGSVLSGDVIALIKWITQKAEANPPRIQPQGGKEASGPCPVEVSE